MQGFICQQRQLLTVCKKLISSMIEPHGRISAKASFDASITYILSRRIINAFASVIDLCLNLIRALVHRGISTVQFHGPKIDTKKTIHKVTFCVVQIHFLVPIIAVRFSDK